MRRELENLLLQDSLNASLLATLNSGVEGGEGGSPAISGATHTHTHSVMQPDNFPMPSNPAPKQRLSESGGGVGGGSGGGGGKKHPPVQRSASLPAHMARGMLGLNSPAQESPSPSSSPSPSPTHTLTAPRRGPQNHASDGSGGYESSSPLSLHSVTATTPAEALLQSRLAAETLQLHRHSSEVRIREIRVRIYFPL
jgi:hypothetical protein